APGQRVGRPFEGERHGNGGELGKEKQHGREDDTRFEIAAIRRPNVRPKIDDRRHQIAASDAGHSRTFSCWLLKIGHGKLRHSASWFVSYRDFHLVTFESGTCARQITPITVRAANVRGVGTCLLDRNEYRPRSRAASIRPGTAKLAVRLRLLKRIRPHPLSTSDVRTANSICARQQTRWPKRLGRVG